MKNRTNLNNPQAFVRHFTRTIDEKSSYDYLWNIEDDLQEKMCVYYEEKYNIKIIYNKHVDKDYYKSWLERHEKKEITCKDNFEARRNQIKQVAIYDVKLIQRQLKENDIIGYFDASERLVPSAHRDVYIITKNWIIKPIEYFDDPMFVTRDICSTDYVAISSPQSTHHECSVLGILYLKELLKHNAEQLKKYTIICHLNDDNSYTDHCFIPSPQVLRYTQNEKFNSHLLNMLRKVKGLSPCLSVGLQDNQNFYRRWVTAYHHYEREWKYMNFNCKLYNKNRELDNYLLFKKIQLINKVSTIKNKNELKKTRNNIIVNRKRLFIEKYARSLHKIYDRDYSLWPTTEPISDFLLEESCNYYEEKYNIKIFKNTYINKNYKEQITKYRTLEARSNRIQQLVLDDMKSIQSKLEKNDIVGYFDFSGALLSTAHRDVYIISKHLIVKPIDYRKGCKPICKSIYSTFPIVRTSPLRDECNSSLLGILYLKELLKDNAEQLKKYTIIGRLNYDSGDTQLYFIPSPQVLKYTQNEKFNSDLLKRLKKLTDTLRNNQNFYHKWIDAYNHDEKRKLMSFNCKFDSKDEKANHYLIFKRNQLLKIAKEIELRREVSRLIATRFPTGRVNLANF